MRFAKETQGWLVTSTGEKGEEVTIPEGTRALEVTMVGHLEGVGRVKVSQVNLDGKWLSIAVKLPEEV